MNGKGSKRRPCFIDDKTLTEHWNSIFKKPKVKRIKCEYWDCGWCYNPRENVSSIASECVGFVNCDYYKQTYENTK